MAKLKKIMLHDNMMTETMDDELVTTAKADNFSTDYTADKLNELYNEFDSITLDNSAIDTITKRDADVVKVSARTKLYLTTGFVITALLLFLMIYNFFVISSLNNSIDILQDDITYQEYQVTDKARKVNDLTNDSVLRDELTEMGYSDISSSEIIVMNSGSANYVPLEGESNWFDKFCEFIGSIFGG